MILIEHIAFMDALHDIGPDDRVQIGLHEVEHEVDILIVLCFEDIEEGDDIGMSVELLQEDDLDGGK